MYIGYDGRNAITGKDRSARYARQLLEALATCVPDNNYVVFGRKLSSQAFAGLNALANVHIKRPRHTEWWRSEAWCVWRSSRRYHIKVFHGLDSHLPSGLGKRTPLKGVVSVADLPDRLPWWRRWWAERRLRNACREAQAVVVPAHAIAERLTAHYGVAPERIVTARPWGADEYGYEITPETRERVAKRYKLAPRYVLVTGELNAETRLPEVIKAIESMGKGAPNLIVLGRTTRYYHKQVKPVAERSSCHMRHISRPHHEDLPALMAMADAVVVAGECMTTSLLNAQRAGRPVVVRSTPWLDELAEGAPSFDNETTLAAALRQVLDDPARWAQHSADVGRRHTAREMANRVTALYRELRYS